MAKDEVKYYRTPSSRNSSYVKFLAQKHPVNDNDPHPSAQVSIERGSYNYWLNPSEGAQPGEQLKLFDVTPSRIQAAFADHRLRAHTPTVLGMAVNQAKQWGYGLTYSEDLSEHSAKLAKRGMELGVALPNAINPEAHQLNAIAESGLGDYQYVRWSARGDLGYEEAHPDEVKAGRETIRGIVRQGLNARKPHLSEQFEDRQMKLPGFE